MSFYCPKRFEFFLKKFPKSFFLKKIFFLLFQAASTGLTLVKTRNLIIFDVDWDPANDDQAAARIHRIGQKQTTTIFRLVGSGTAEEQIYNLSTNKTVTALEVLDGKSLQCVNEKIKFKSFFTYTDNRLSEEDRLSALQTFNHNPIITSVLEKIPLGRIADYEQQIGTQEAPLTAAEMREVELDTSLDIQGSELPELAQVEAVQGEEEEEPHE